jgi:hypothetical protein
VENDDEYETPPERIARDPATTVTVAIKMADP